MTELQRWAAWGCAGAALFGWTLFAFLFGYAVRAINCGLAHGFTP